MVQDLLAATGDSFTLSDGTTIDGTNATKVLQHDLYWKYLSSGSNMSEGNDLCDALVRRGRGIRVRFGFGEHERVLAHEAGLHHDGRP